MSGMLSDGHRSWHSMLVDKTSGQTMLTDGIAGGNFPLSYDEAQFLFQSLSEYLSRGEKAIDAILQAAYDEQNNRQRQRVERPAKPKQVKPGFVYLIQSPSGYFKIGYSSTPEDRLKTFGIQMPMEVEYCCLIQTDDMRQLEKQLHKRFAEKRVNGEWFDLLPEDVDYVKGLANA